MRKIISLFQRNYDTDQLVRNEVVPGAEWVINGEGVATRKWDGTCCLVRAGQLYKRYELKPGKTPPKGFEPACEIDPITGKQQGWILTDCGNPADKWHFEGYRNYTEATMHPGTYELCGPSVNANPEGFKNHILIPHGKEILPNISRDFDGIKTYLSTANIEGIVWWHPDGRMVKIKAKDFGMQRRS